MMNNKQIAYNTQFTPYEVQHTFTNFQQSGLTALPQMPGYTPVLMNIPAFPMQAFAPNFLFQPNPNVQQTSPLIFPMPSPNFVPVAFNMAPSNSPPQMMPLLSLSPNPLPPPFVQISSPPHLSQPSLQTEASHSASSSLPSYLGAALHVPERSRSPSASVCSESDSGDVEIRNRSVSREMPPEAPSKRALVDQTLGWMQSVFGNRYDNDGMRGENVLRLKVKTVIALEQIVEFITLCNKEGLIHSISCPVSTKKRRQHVRGYLAYMKGFTGASADRIETIFEEFNKEKGYPFKTLHRNPASTL